MGCFLNKVSSPRLQIASTLQLTHTWVLPYYITCARLFKSYYKYPELGSTQPKVQQELSGAVGTRHYRQEYIDLRIRDRRFNCTVNKQYAGKIIYVRLRGSLTNLKDVRHQQIGRDDAATDGGSAPTDWDTPEADARAAGGAAEGGTGTKGGLPATDGSPGQATDNHFGQLCRDTPDGKHPHLYSIRLQCWTVDRLQGQVQYLCWSSLYSWGEDGTSLPDEPDDHQLQASLHLGWPTDSTKRCQWSHVGRDLQVHGRTVRPQEIYCEGALQVFVWHEAQASWDTTWAGSSHTPGRCKPAISRPSQIHRMRPWGPVSYAQSAMRRCWRHSSRSKMTNWLSRRQCKWRWRQKMLLRLPRRPYMVPKQPLLQRQSLRWAKGRGQHQDTTSIGSLQTYQFPRDRACDVVRQTMLQKTVGSLMPLATSATSRVT